MKEVGVGDITGNVLERYIYSIKKVKDHAIPFITRVRRSAPQRERNCAYRKHKGERAEGCSAWHTVAIYLLTYKKYIYVNKYIPLRYIYIFFGGEFFQTYRIRDMP